MPSTTDDRLGRLGDVLWLTAKAAVLAFLVTVTVLLALGALGSVTAWLATLGGVVFLLGVGYALFGNWEWTPGGEARQHATFLVALVALNVVFWSLPGWAFGRPASSPTGAFLRLFAAFLLLATAGWLAYLGGLAHLRSLVTSVG